VWRYASNADAREPTLGVPPPRTCPPVIEPRGSPLTVLPPQPCTLCDERGERGLPLAAPADFLEPFFGLPGERLSFFLRACT